jgi:hypothetical protein
MEKGAFGVVFFIIDLYLKVDLLPLYLHVNVKAAEFVAHSIRRHFGVCDLKLPDTVKGYS